jgi:hypothetical protein
MTFLTRAAHLGLLLLLAGGCGGPPLPQLHNFTGANRVVIIGLDHRDTLGILRDPNAVRALVQFVDARNSDWEIPWAGVPIPQVQAEFYDTTGFRGSFGGGPGFFETQRQALFASRSASAEDIAVFARLTGVTVTKVNGWR